jgi:glycosyltransferase involved in cell wall biosynthesis
VNSADRLSTAISSVLASPLVPSPAQIVVVDDDSHDWTPYVARAFGVTYTRVAFHNISDSRNAGFALTRTPYVAFLDHDDAWLEGNLEPQLAALEANMEAAFAYGITQCAADDLRPISLYFPSPPLAQGHDPGRLHLSYPNLGVVLFRREVIAEAGGFDPRVRYQQDGELMIRIAARRPIIGVEHVGMLHRLRPPSWARSDYYWTVRDVTKWRPKNVGVDRASATRFKVKTRGLFCYRFLEDAGACLADGSRRDAAVCLVRAVRVSPLHAVANHRRIWSIVQSLGRKGPAKRTVNA